MNTLMTSQLNKLSEVIYILGSSSSHKQEKVHHKADLRVEQAETERRERTSGGGGLAAITTERKSGHCHWRRDETMTTVPTVGQHLENERGMEPGKPAQKRVLHPPTHSHTHEDTLTNCSESAQPLVIQQTHT